MKKLIIIAGALMLSACVSHNFSEGRRAEWRCAGDKEFSLREVAGAVEVYAGGQTNRLTPNGERSYSNGTVTYSVDRGRATLTGASGGPYENCSRAGWLPSIW
ncbi:MAG: hypothetical protein K2P70_07050 [Hyphomonadaceae bacterium]|nr:hypothetical protein [Hyphomonadaceae bacterium]